MVEVLYNLAEMDKQYHLGLETRNRRHLPFRIKGAFGIILSTFKPEYLENRNYYGKLSETQSHPLSY